MSNIGAVDRSSHPANPISAIEPRMKEPTTVVMVQPWLLPWTRPYTTPNRPALTNTTPTRSNGERLPRDSDSFHQASGIRAIPTGTFSQKMYCQDHPLVTAPPTSGPKAMAVPPIAHQIPSAKFLRSGGTAALNRDRDRGMIMAPPAPWRARAMTSTPMLGAKPARAEAA